MCIVIVSDYLLRAARKSDEMLEPYEGKLSRTVLREEGGSNTTNLLDYEFSHTLEEQIAGQLRAGFAMIDFYESKDSRNRLTQFASDYIANLSIKW